MALFKFRLERVLSVRRHEEERERGAFAAAVQKHSEAEAFLADIRDKIQLAEKSMIAIVGENRIATIEDFVRSHEYRVGLVRREDEATLVLEHAHRMLNDARLRLVEARKKRRVLERLRERRHEDWRRDEEGKEQTELDEIGLATFVRREAI